MRFPKQDANKDDVLYCSSTCECLIAFRAPPRGYRQHRLTPQPEVTRHRAPRVLST